MHFKDLSQLPRLALGDPAVTPVLDLVVSHASSRAFRRSPLLRSQLAALLKGISINRIGGQTNYAGSLRTYPSAGARYPVDTYLLVLQSEDVEPGAYFFDPRDFSIRQISHRDYVNAVVEVFGEGWTADASLVVFFVAQWHRSNIKYGDRGFAYAYIEAGHMAQNLILIARHLGLAICPVGGFWEDRVEGIFRLVTPEESPLYALLIGVGKD